MNYRSQIIYKTRIVKCKYDDAGSCRLTATRQVSHVEQELVTLPDHMSLSPVFNGVRVFVFCVMFCRALFVPFLLVIMLSVLL